MTFFKPNFDLGWLIDSFDPITLAQLNEKA